MSDNKPESKSSVWSCGPVARTMKETEEQLLLVSRENQVLKIKVCLGCFLGFQVNMCALQSS